MTTTVKITTHDWPAVANINSSHEYFDGMRSSEGWTRTHEFVPPHSERTFTLTDTQTVSFEELPKDATSLPVCRSCAEDFDEIEIINVTQEAEEEAAVN